MHMVAGLSQPARIWKLYSKIRNVVQSILINGSTLAIAIGAHFDGGDCEDTRLSYNCMEHPPQRDRSCSYSLALYIYLALCMHPCVNRSI